MLTVPIFLGVGDNTNATKENTETILEACRSADPETNAEKIKHITTSRYQNIKDSQ
jgi:hypothetical protein